MAKKYQIINHTKKTIAYCDELGLGLREFTVPGDSYIANPEKGHVDDKIYSNKGYKTLTGYDQ
jgi:hypothetical protein